MIKFKNILNENATFNEVNNEIFDRFSRYYEASLAGIKAELQKIELYLRDIKAELTQAHGESYAKSIFVEYGEQFDSWDSVTIHIYYPKEYKNALGKWIDVTNGNTGVEVTLLAKKLAANYNLNTAQVHPWTSDVVRGTPVLRQSLKIYPPRIQYKKP